MTTASTRPASTRPASPSTVEIDRTYDVVIAGGGIGGCVAALALHRHAPAARVLLLEGGSFPRHKVCGEFFSPEGWEVLRRLKLDAALLQRGAHAVTHARVLTSRARSGAIALPAAAWAISRWQLDDLLWQRAHEVCDARERCRVRHIRRAEEGFLVETRDTVFRARFVLNAMGRNAHHEVEHETKSTPHTSHAHAAYNANGARYVGVKTHFLGAHIPSDEVQLFPFHGGYCGLAEVEDKRVNACLLVRYSAFANPEKLWRRALNENTALREAMHGATPAMPWLATGNVTFGKMEPIEDGVLRCGDAAGYIQPFAGDGQAMAARGGELAAACIGAALRDNITDDDARALYESAWKREFAPRLQWGQCLQPLMLAPHAGAIAARVLSVAPFIGNLAARRTRGY